MQTGLARLGGISLDSNGAPGQPGLNLPCKCISPGNRASIETLFSTKKLAKIYIGYIKIADNVVFNRKFV